MNDKQMKQIMELCKSIESKQGSGSIYSLGSKNASAGVARFNTGLEDFNNILGGGAPRGRMIEIFGPESSGKTSLAYHLAGTQEMALFIPAEGTFDAQRAKIFKNKPKQLLVYRDNKFAEDIIDKCNKFAELGIPLIIIDSVPHMVPKALYELTLKETEKQPQRGQLASLFSRTLKPLTDIIERSGTTIIFINQVRDKMDAMMFGDKFDTPGGRALKHAMSVRIQVGRRAWIEVPNKNPSNSATTEKAGLIMKAKVVKSKICNPYGEAELPMFFDRGFVGFGEMDDIRKEIMKENSIKYKNK
jgi:recombination protein RecA